MLRTLSRYRTEKGFTLIELLIVIVIIGILIAGAALAYNIQVQKADRSAGVKTLKLAATAAESAADTGDYSTLTASPSALVDNGYNGTATVVSADGSGYCLEETTPKGVTLSYDSDAGVVADGACGAGTFEPGNAGVSPTQVTVTDLGNHELRIDWADGTSDSGWFVRFTHPDDPNNFEEAIPFPDPNARTLTKTWLDMSFGADVPLTVSIYPMAAGDPDLTVVATVTAHADGTHTIG